MRMRAAAAAAGMLAALMSTSAAGAQGPRVRLAASTDCPVNVNCIPGFKRVYGMDPTSLFTRLTAADAGVQALDDGVAEVAVAFSSNPELSRPDIRTLRDDRHLVGPDRIVPVARTTLLRRYGRPLRARLNAASKLLSTL